MSVFSQNLILPFISSYENVFNFSFQRFTKSSSWFQKDTSILIFNPLATMLSFSRDFYVPAESFKQTKVIFEDHHPE